MNLKNIIIELGNKKDNKLTQVNVEGIYFDSSLYYPLVIDFDLDQKIGTCQVFKKDSVLFANIYFYPHLYKEFLPLYLEMFPNISFTFRKGENPEYCVNQILDKCKFDSLSLSNLPNQDGVKSLKNQVKNQKIIIRTSENQKIIIRTSENKRYFTFTVDISNRFVEFCYITDNAFPSREELINYVKLQNISYKNTNPIIVFMYEFKNIEDYEAYNKKI